MFFIESSSLNLRQQRHTGCLSLDGYFFFLLCLWIDFKWRKLLLFFLFFFFLFFLRSLDTVPSEPVFKSWSKISPLSPDCKILMSLSFVFQQPRCKLLMPKCMIFKPIWTLPAFPWQWAITFIASACQISGALHSSCYNLLSAVAMGLRGSRDSISVMCWV